MAILAAPVRKITGARVASRGVNYPLLGLAFIGLAIAKVMTVWWELEQRLPEVFFGTDGCTRHRDMMSPEDIVPVFDGVFLGSSDERRQHMMRSIGAEASPWGDLFAIWDVDKPGKDPKTAILEIEGFPEDTAFHPHGMNYRPETGELFVINHAYSQGGERIDVFKVSEAFPQEPLPSIHPSLLEFSSSHEMAALLIPIALSILRPQRPSCGPVRRGTSLLKVAGATGHDTRDKPSVRVRFMSFRLTFPRERIYSHLTGAVWNCKTGWLFSPSRVGTVLGRSKAVTEVDLDDEATARAAAAVKAARTKGLARGVAPLKLTYSFSVEHEIINTNYGVLNDLVLTSDDELYVTQFLAMRHPLHGPTQPDGLIEHLQMFASILSILLQMSPAPVIRCTGIRGADIECERLAKGRGVMYNGVALSPNGERLLVSDTAASQMVVFNRSLETGALTLRQRLDLPASPDNLELDLYRAAEGTEAYTLGLVSAMDYFQYARAMDGATHPTDGDDRKMKGGFASIVFDKESGKYESSLEMWHDGSLLSISSAASTKSGARLLGSAVEEGFLLCRPPPCPLGSEGAGGVCPWGPPPSTGPPSMEEGSESKDADDGGWGEDAAGTGEAE
ncbi:unnamed protein product [Scytosiphon promiscuus]